MRKEILLVFYTALLIFTGCSKDNEDTVCVDSDYTGSWKNYNYTETLIGTFVEGIYTGDQIPPEVKQLRYGRIEVDFNYLGGGLNYFAPLFYYGSLNRNENDDYAEEPQFHLAIEIGHYNVIPTRVDYLFYTICTYNYPRYCRDTYIPVTPATDYSLIIDKKPEGIILQLKEGDKIVNIFPHAFFTDSIQMFFKDVTVYTEANQGDSLQNVLMVGKGFAGIERGIHHFNGHVNEVRIYKYDFSEEDYDYELMNVRNQHNENQRIRYKVTDRYFDGNIAIWHEFRPYRMEAGEMIPDGEMKTGGSEIILNSKELSYCLKKEDIGFYKIYMHTLDENGNILRSLSQPFEIWVYPEEWQFDFY